MTDLIASLVWPAVAVTLTIMFRNPLEQLLWGLARKVERAKIRIGNVEWDTAQLDEIIADREVLRLAVQLANADQDFSEQESQYLLYVADSLRRSVENLSPESAQRVLREVVRVALADKEFREAEYAEIYRQAQRFGISDKALRELIVFECKQVSVDLPRRLQGDGEEGLR